MSTWEFSWLFQNAHMPEHGKTGIGRVDSEDVNGARYLSKCAASNFIFGTTAYQTYVKITGIMEVNAHQW